MDYIAYLHKENSSDYGVSFPDFPGCVTAGKTLHEAYEMAAEALALHIQGMVEDGDVIPEPSTLDQLAGDPDLADGMVALVHAEALHLTDSSKGSGSWNKDEYPVHAPMGGGQE